ncbi:hypothetical protein [Ideonella livida]|uniref:Uncharacterized protein n=1 Tax=Ideonella livida TaxID=2707176 RepID=A0A7C9TIM0_9BURK|nr:hypothetical protein [Ideonella livida]NDY91340.1 hypothetical protein [Ideonella livida]
MQAHVLIGNPHTRKSSLLRCLTGCFNRNVRDIALAQGGAVRVYARVAALQESRTEVADFMTEVVRSRCEHTVFALWPEAHPGDPERWPGATAYLQHLADAGWRLQRVAVLGAHPWTPPKALAGRELLRLPEVLSQPVNLSAQRIRQHFGWL